MTVASHLTRRSNGFTIVELLIVVVVIAILAAITIISYNGIQERARNTKIKSDIAYLMKAAAATAVLTNKTLHQLSNSGGTAEQCVTKATGTNLATLPKTDPCWANYLSFLDKLSVASNMDVRSLVDPWGRPYYIDENEGENGIGCNKDTIAAYTQPFQTGWNPGSSTPLYNVPLTGLTGCV